MKIKFNGGNRALLCEQCHTIIATEYWNPSIFNKDNSDKLYFCSPLCMVNFGTTMGRDIVIMEPENGNRHYEGD